MNPKRLFLVRPTLAGGGADRVTLTLLQHLDRRRFETTLVLVRRTGELLDAVPAGVEVVSLDANNILSASRPLQRLVRHRRPDIVFSTSGGTNITAALATPRDRMRLVLSERNGLVRDQQHFKKWALFFAKRALYRRAHCITAVSQGVAGDLKRRLKLSESQVRVVYNPVVLPETDDLARQPIDEPWFNDEVPVLVGAGRLQEVKGFDLLLQCLAEVRRDRPCRLILLGEGPLRPVLERQAEDLGIADAVKLAGFVDNPYPYLRRATAFVLSSHFEGLPGVLIQAMACGTAAIATRCPFGPEEIIEHSNDGMLVPTNDVGALTRAVLGLLSDDALRQRLGKAGRQSAMRFTLERSLPSYVDALDPKPS